MDNLAVKVVLLGSQAVGKTSILLRQSGQGFTHQLSPTIGASFCRSEIYVDEKCRVQLQIWDTAGQERFRAMAPMYYRNASAAVVVYDITNKHSFADAKAWVDELNQCADSIVVQCVVGNKADLNEKREVPTSTGEAYALSIGALFFETSALTFAGIPDLFHNLALALRDRKASMDANRLHQSFYNSSEENVKSTTDGACCSLQ